MELYLWHKLLGVILVLRPVVGWSDNDWQLSFPTGIASPFRFIYFLTFAESEGILVKNRMRYEIND